VVVAFVSMDGFVAGTYFISFMRFAGIPLATTAAITIISRVGSFLGVLASGPVADFCKRRVAAYIAIGLTTLLSYPLTLAVLSKRIRYDGTAERYSTCRMTWRDRRLFSGW
jgi:MHS family shikimate/dehydroshikimate transporter-like MFS transporter